LLLLKGFGEHLVGCCHDKQTLGRLLHDDQKLFGWLLAKRKQYLTSGTLSMGKHWFSA
jgi:hypothetical protein